MNATKHFLTGLFVLGGLVLVCVLVVWFEGVAGWLRGGYIVRGHLSNSMGVRPGKRVHRDGMHIGEVAAVESSLPEPGVWIAMEIQEGERIPANAEFVAQTSPMGDVFLDFRSPGGPSGDTLATDGSARVRGAATPITLLPNDLLESLRQGMDQLGNLEAIIQNVKEMTEPRSAEDVREGAKPANLPSMVAEFSEAARGLTRVMQKPEESPLARPILESIDELKKAVAEARTALGEATTTLKHYRGVGDNLNAALKTADTTLRTYDAAGKKLTGSLEKINAVADRAKALLDQLNALTADVRGGQGTAGKLLTDDTLHRRLVNLAENLAVLTDEAQRLITMWRKEGVLAKEGD